MLNHASPTCLIADDEPHLAAYLRTRLALLWPELVVVGVAGNGIEARNILLAERPDIAFLDIKMPGLSGLELLKDVAATHCVLVTAYNQFAVEAFESDAIDYLLKPVSDERLQKTITRLRQRMQLGTPTDLSALLQTLQRSLKSPAPERLRWIRAGVGQEVKLIPVEEVCYFQATDKYTNVVTVDGEFLIRTALKELADQLDPDQFWQIHRSTVVSVRQIAGTQRDFAGRIALRLKGRPETLAVSRAFAHLFRQM